MKSQWKRISNIQRASKVLIFLQENRIATVEQLADKVTEIHQRQYDLANNVKSKERRITKLNEHLKHVDIFKQHKAIYAKYKQLDPKKRGAYAEKHEEKLAQFEAAADYLKAHLNGRTVIPEKDWRAEQKTLLAERYALVEKYYKLNDDIKNVEALRRGAENLIRDITPERIPARAQSMEL